MIESGVGSEPRHGASGRAWRRSSFCASGECVEVTERDGLVLLRNSKDPGVVLQYTGAEWRSFLGGIRAGEFDDLGDNSGDGAGV